MTWSSVATATAQGAANTGYLLNNGSAGVSMALPASPNVGDTFQVVGVGSGAWMVLANSGQSILQNIKGTGAASSHGLTGGQADAVSLVYAGSGSFVVTSVVGSTNGLGNGYVFQGGLTWVPPSATTMTFSDAVLYCGSLNVKGITGWRLATTAELLSLNGSGTVNGQGWGLATTWTWAGDDHPAGYAYTVVLPEGYHGTVGDSNYANVICTR